MKKFVLILLASSALLVFTGCYENSNTGVKTTKATKCGTGKCGDAKKVEKKEGKCGSGKCGTGK